MSYSVVVNRVGLIVITLVLLLATIVRLQSWWRMSKMRRAFFQIIADRREVKKLYFRAIKIYWQSEKMRYVRIDQSLFHLQFCDVHLCVEYAFAAPFVWQVLLGLERRNVGSETTTEAYSNLFHELYSTHASEPSSSYGLFQCKNSSPRIYAIPLVILNDFSKC